MSWNKVGTWLKDNAGTGATLVGSLLTGNLPGAVAAGIALVSDATGTDDAEQALVKLKQDPQATLRLQELAYQERDQIRQHIKQMHELELKDKQAEQNETQTTIRIGDTAEDPFVRRTRPAQSWVSLFAAIAYVFVVHNTGKEIDVYILGALLTLPFTYAGLRGFDKFNLIKAGKGK
jgi:hypothetical protein